MTEQQWRYHTPERDGHAPDDWDGGEVQHHFITEWTPVKWPQVVWYQGKAYRYTAMPYNPVTTPEYEAATCRPCIQDATYETSSPSLLAQCLALPQDQREALIEAMQKPQRDWADEVFLQLAFCWDSKTARRLQAGDYTTADEACVRAIRSMCRPKEELQHVAYYDEGQFHWMSGIAPRDCELFAKRKDCA